MIKYNVLRIVCKSHVVFIWFSFLTCSAITWDSLRIPVKKDRCSSTNIQQEGLLWWFGGEESIVRPVPETWIWSLIQEDPTCRRTSKPVYHDYGASKARELQLPSPRATTTEARVTKGPCSARREATKNRRLHATIKSGLRLLNVGKSPHNNRDPAHPKINEYNLF